MESLQSRLGYTFETPALLENALTHSSYANEHRGGGLPSNERLEFLGDSILGMVVADRLYRTHPHLSEGELTRMRAALVCEASLVEAARALSLGDCLRLGKGEDAGGGRTRASILADATEAVIAALYLDGGIAQAGRVIEQFILDRAPRAAKNRDFKTLLQEFIQREAGQTLSYRLVEESGPDHEKRFTVEVALSGDPVGRGTGRTKKEAEQAAARAALHRLT